MLVSVAGLAAYALRAKATGPAQLAPFARDYGSYAVQFQLGSMDVFKDYTSAFLRGSSGIADVFLGKGFGKLGSAISGEVSGLEQNVLDRAADRIDGVKLPGEVKLGDQGYFSSKPAGRADGRLIAELGVLAIPAPALKGSGIMTKLASHVIDVGRAESVARIVRVGEAVLEVLPAAVASVSRFAKGVSVTSGTTVQPVARAKNK
jgi:hypothetical protein